MPKIVHDEVIFQVAIEQVVNCGYAGATTRQIAELARVSEMTLFRRYGSKARLVTQAFQAALDDMDFAWAAHYTGDLKTDLGRVVAHYQSLAQRHGPFMLALLVELPRQPELAALLEGPLELVQAVARLVSRYQGEGALRREPPLQTVAALIGPLIYSIMMRQALPGSEPGQPGMEAHLAGFLSGRQSEISHQDF